MQFCAETVGWVHLDALSRLFGFTLAIPLNAKDEAVPASRRPSGDPHETGPGEKEGMEAGAWEIPLLSQPGEAFM